MNTEKFQNDLKTGQEAEHQFAELMAGLGYTVESTQGKGRFSDYDVIVTNNGYRLLFEVKTDRDAHVTNNVMVEVGKIINNEEQPSGLSATKADYFVYKFYGDENFYAMPVERLKQQVADRKYKHQLYGGDGNRSKLVMFDFKSFKRDCEIINRKTMAK